MIQNGRIYDIDGKLLCEIKNGNGKRREYYDSFDKLKFKGEYLNDKRNGKGKENYPDSILKYKGEYLNGEKNEKGKGYFFIFVN